MTQIEALQRNGIHRLGTARNGFRYLRAGGGKVSAAEVDRIRKLRLPPAWTDVAVNPSPTGRLQAVGKDAAGRWQYRYHPSFVEKQQQKKFHRILQFARALPRMRASIDLGLRTKGLGQERVMACILRILSTCFIRPGSQAYADEHGAYGLATLLKRHVRVKGDLVQFDYTGKSHQKQHRELRDRRVARVVRELLRSAPGKDLFQYQDQDGNWVDVRRIHINQHIKQVMGERFSAKDFRTWAGTLICACALARNGACAPDETKAARKKRMVEAVKETAQHLGNTPAVCRSAYIYPSVFQGFDRGQVVSHFFDTVEELTEARVKGLHHSERALLAFLEKSEQAVGGGQLHPKKSRSGDRSHIQRGASRPRARLVSKRASSPKRRRLPVRRAAV